MAGDSELWKCARSRGAGRKESRERGAIAWEVSWCFQTSAKDTRGGGFHVEAGGGTARVSTPACVRSFWQRKKTPLPLWAGLASSASGRGKWGVGLVRFSYFLSYILLSFVCSNN